MSFKVPKSLELPAPTAVASQDGSDDDTVAGTDNSMTNIHGDGNVINISDAWALVRSAEPIGAFAAVWVAILVAVLML
jgi:hypothetical protein